MMMDIGEAFHSPFIVPVAGCAMALGIVISAKISEVKKRQLEYDERMAAIAKGLPLPPLESEAKYSTVEQVFRSAAGPEYKQVAQMQQNRRRGGIRRAGIVLIAVSAGIALFFATLTWILQERDVLCGAATALIPFAIGVGLLIDASISKKEEMDAAVDAALAVRE